MRRKGRARLTPTKAQRSLVGSGMNDLFDESALRNWLRGQGPSVCDRLVEIKGRPVDASTFTDLVEFELTQRGVDWLIEAGLNDWNVIQAKKAVSRSVDIGIEVARDVARRHLRQRRLM